MKSGEGVNPQYLVDADGQKTAVVLPIEDFRALVERLEELEDLELIESRKSEPRISVSSLEDLLQPSSTARCAFSKTCGISRKT